jgi:DNA polymerase II small subunit/DNA polymerase delta subunit B
MNRVDTYMSYYSDITGRLEISRNAVKELPAELVQMAAKYEVTLPEPVKGLTKQAIKTIKNDDSLDWFVTPKKNALIFDASEANIEDFSEILEAVLAIVSDDDAVANGVIYRTGEATGDVERFIVKDNNFVAEAAELIWPNGERVTEV